MHPPVKQQKSKKIFFAIILVLVGGVSTSAYATTPTPVLTANVNQCAVTFSWTSVPGADYYTVKNGVSTLYSGSGFTMNYQLNDNQSLSVNVVAHISSDDSFSDPSNTVPVTGDCPAPEAPPTPDTTPQEITPRDAKLVALFTAMLIGYVFIKQFKWRGND